MKKLIALLLCLSMLFGMAAIAEEAAVTAVTDDAAQAATTAVTLNDTDVLATVGEETVTWAEVSPIYDSLVASYGSYYDMEDNSNVELFRAVALENAISTKVLGIKAVELGLSPLTEEEAAAAEASAQADWDSAVANYVAANHTEITDESTQEEKDAAEAEAVQYYNEMGYSPETLKDEYKEYAVYDKVQAYATQDVTVTDEEVEAEYQQLVAADKELYQNDISAYVEYNNYVDQMAMYAMYYGSANDMDYAWYRPAGFRSVKHILLKVDDELMTAYKDLQARLEEQMESEDAAAADTAEATEATEAVAAEETAAPAEPVTQADVDNAKADILASLQDKIEEINQKIAEGADFDELIATYAVDADGNATDPGMTSEPYKTSGYEVCSASTNYVPEFVEAAFSVNEIGEVSAPYISDYGVHIVKYIGDVAEGPIAMTDEQREAKREALLTSKQNEKYSAAMDEWMGECAIAYTGVTPSMKEIEDAQAAAAEEAAAAVAEEETVTATTDEGEAAPEATDAPAAN